MSEEISEALKPLGQRSGLSGPKLAATQLPLLIDVPDNWTREDRTLALMYLILELASSSWGDLEKHRLALKAALRIITGDEASELGPIYQEKVAAWSGTRLDDRLLDFRVCWDATQGKSHILTDDEERERLADTTRKMWYRARKELAGRLSLEIERRNRLERTGGIGAGWQKPSLPTSPFFWNVREELQREGNHERGELRRQPIPVRSEYVHRENEEAEFRRLVDEEGAKLIAFVGQPGMGKTWLARAVAQGAPRIRTLSGRIQIPDVLKALGAEAADAWRGGPIDPQACLTALLCKGNAPPIIILDNLDSVDDLRYLLPADETTSIVVVTSRVEGDAPPSHCRFIRVGKMQLPEATQLVRAELPALSGEDAKSIVSTLDGYPLAIKVACKLFARRNLSVAEFCRHLHEDIRALADGAYTEEGTTLLAVLKRLVTLMKAREPLSYLLLLCICFGPAEFVMSEFLMVFLKYSTDLPASALRSTRALQVLYDFSLIEDDISYIEGSQVVNGRYEVRRLEYPIVAIHSFTHDVLSQELSDDLLIVGARAAKLCRYLAGNDEWMERFEDSLQVIGVIALAEQLFISTGTRILDAAESNVEASELAAEYGLNRDNLKVVTHSDAEGNPIVTRVVNDAIDLVSARERARRRT